MLYFCIIIAPHTGMPMRAYLSTTEWVYLYVEPVFRIKVLLLLFPVSINSLYIVILIKEIKYPLYFLNIILSSN